MDGTLAFSECIAVDDNRERCVRQGDVFEWLGRGHKDPWTHLGIIVTADCDITHAKHRGILSYVPVLALSDYVALFHFPAKVTKASAPLRDQLVKALRAFQAERASDFPQPISIEAALRWIRELSPEGVIRELDVPAGKQQDEFLSLARDYLAFESGVQDGTFEALRDALVLLRSRQAGSQDQVIAKLWSEVETFIANLPGDAFFLGSAGPDHRKGYVAYLRMVREIGQSEIAVRQIELRDSSVRAKRIAALSSPYIYRLTQQLGAVFAAIGLPTEYENARTETLRRVSQTPRSET